jgi:hypothetical protein
VHRPQVVEGTQRYWAIHYTEVVERLHFQAGDLFESIPVAIGPKNIYLLSAVLHAFGTELTNARYRGLVPATKLILKRNGGNFSMNNKRRTNFDGERVVYFTPKPRYAFIFKCRYQSQLAQGHSVETVQLLLGHANIDCTHQYLEVDPKKLRDMFAAVL